jgi:hypothetical protein
MTKAPKTTAKIKIGFQAERPRRGLAGGGAGLGRPDSFKPD